MARLIKFLFFLVKPKHSSENTTRKEYILNVLLVGVVFLSLVAVISSQIIFLATIEKGLIETRVPIIIPIGVFFLFLFLFFLSKLGFAKISAYIFIIILFLCATYTSLFFGINVPESLLIYALIIVISGILINTKFSFLITFAISISLLFLFYIQSKKIFLTDTSWQNEPFHYGDVVVFIITFFVITITSWLSNREIERSLDQAKKSEKKLQRQRDLLELKVQERTKEIQEVKMEEFVNLHKFASIGRLAAGLIHDLSTPLTTIALNLELLKDKNHSQMINRAIEASKKIAQYIEVTRKQLQHQNITKIFSAKKEINQVLKMLSYKAQRKKIKITLICKKGIKIRGNNLLFSQLITNLINNALDAYEENKQYKKREIEIKLRKELKSIILTISDWGNGISAKDLTHIFEPFFTTKNVEKGTGIGLTIGRDIIEKDFKGTIKVQSKKNQGTMFTIKIPMIKNKND